MSVPQWAINLTISYPAAKWHEGYFEMVTKLAGHHGVTDEIPKAVDNWCMNNLEPYALPTPQQLIAECQKLKTTKNTVEDMEGLKGRTMWAREYHRALSRIRNGDYSVIATIEPLRQNLKRHGMETHFESLDDKLQRYKNYIMVDFLIDVGLLHV